MNTAPSAAETGIEVGPEADMVRINVSDPMTRVLTPKQARDLATGIAFVADIADQNAVERSLHNALDELNDAQSHACVIDMDLQERLHAICEQADALYLSLD